MIDSSFKYFRYEDMIGSTTADNNHIDNRPKDDVIIANIMFTLNQLDKIREKFGQPITISSGYRCYELNRLVRGAKTSNHLWGFAADIYTTGAKNNKDLYEFIKKNFLFDELIGEKPNKNGIFSWVHVAFKHNVAENRKECLIMRNGQYYRDLT